jgi:hypothetical protein
VKTTIYVHGDEESNWEKGEQLGLSEDAIKENFKYALYEVGFVLDVNEDGTYKILSLEIDKKKYALKEIK